MSEFIPAPPPPFSAGAAMPPYLADLNEAQRQAVEAIEGPVLVLAGACESPRLAVADRRRDLHQQGGGRDAP